MHSILQIRPHARTYSITSEQDHQFPCTDVYFVGIRVKHAVEIKQMQVDLTGTRQRFFDSLDENLKGKNETIENLIKERLVDIKIEYR